MKLRLSLLIGATLLVLGTVAAACDGDEKLTWEEFIQRVQAINDDFQERSLPLYDAFPDEGEEENEENNLSAYKSALAEFPILFAEIYDELETLNPPTEAEDAFDELLTAGREAVAFQEKFRDDFQGAESFAEIKRIVDEADAELQAIGERLLATCQSLQDIADANGVVASLGCAVGE